VRRRGAGDEHAIALLKNFTGNLNDLHGRFSGTEDDLRETLP